MFHPTSAFILNLFEDFWSKINPQFKTKFQNNNSMAQEISNEDLFWSDYLSNNTLENIVLKDSDLKDSPADTRFE